MARVWRVNFTLDFQRLHQGGRSAKRACPALRPYAPARPYQGNPAEIRTVAQWKETARSHSFAIVVLLLAAVYVALAWTPSSYGTLLEQLGFDDTGVILGEARPIREDEWVRWTASFLAAVGNDFRRINETSVYREDLRNVEGLPLRDWAIVFKPYDWPFFLIDAAHAFSFYHAFIIAAFLIGYERLFRALGSPAAQAAFGSLALYFTSFTQAWWTTYGPVLAGFPWVMLVVLAGLRPWLKALLLAYVTTAWLLANLYPPIMITLAFAGFIVMLALRRDALRPASLVACAGGVVLAAGLILLYFEETFRVMAQTVYPGQRVLGGGGESLLQWAGHLFPFLPMSGYTHLVNVNICEAASVGTYLPLALLFFVERSGFATRLRERQPGGRSWGWQLAVLAGGIVLVSAWMFVPLPAWVGMPLLWHRVPPFRMWYVCGLLVLILSLTVVRMAPLRVSPVRLAGFSVTVVAAWLVSERLLPEQELPLSLADLWILVPVGALLGLRRRAEGILPAALIASVALANLLAFGSFNPLQSAHAIFDRDGSPLERALDRLAERHPQGWLVLLGGYGAWLNGWGYASPTHVLYAPQLEFFRTLFPELPEARFDELFNRTSYIHLGTVAEPQLYGCCMITVPIDAFEPPTLAVEVRSGITGAMPLGGRLEHKQILWNGQDVVVHLQGWAMLDASRSDSELRIHTDLPIRRAVAYPVLRPEIAKSVGDPDLVLSGFELQLTLDRAAYASASQRDGSPPSPTALRRIGGHTLCLESVDPERGRHLIRAPSATECRAPSPR